MFEHILQGKVHEVSNAKLYVMLLVLVDTW